MRLFVERIGISKQNSIIDFSVLENCLRENLDTIAPRRMATIAPMKLVLTNLPEDHEEQLIFPNHPKTTHKAPEQCRSHANYGSNAMIFPKSPQGLETAGSGGEVRLRGAGIARIDEVVKNAEGHIIALHGWLDPTSRPGMEGAHRKVKGTIHWVSAPHARQRKSPVRPAVLH